MRRLSTNDEVAQRAANAARNGLADFRVAACSCRVRAGDCVSLPIVADGFRSFEEAAAAADRMTAEGGPYYDASEGTVYPRGYVVLVGPIVAEFPAATVRL